MYIMVAMVSVLFQRMCNCILLPLHFSPAKVLLPVSWLCIAALQTASDCLVRPGYWPSTRVMGSRTTRSRMRMRSNPRVSEGHLLSHIHSP